MSDTEGEPHSLNALVEENKALRAALLTLRNLAVELVRVVAGDEKAAAAKRIIDSTTEGRRFFAQERE